MKLTWQINLCSWRHWVGISICCSALVACVGTSPGPDKQFESSLIGAASGAGSGMVTGFQLGGPLGPGAAIGMGLGAVAGGIEGFARDQIEDDLLDLQAKTRRERERAIAQDIISENYRRRLELHPTKEIYPADVFFTGDEAKLSMQGRMVLKELARLNSFRLPWSRMVVASYVRSNDKENTFAHYLAERRALAIGNYLVHQGFEPRRIVARAVLMDGALLIDPHDAPERYNQAIEIIPLDR